MTSSRFYFLYLNPRHPGSYTHLYVLSSAPIFLELVWPSDKGPSHYHYHVVLRHHQMALWTVSTQVPVLVSSLSAVTRSVPFPLSSRPSSHIVTRSFSLCFLRRAIACYSTGLVFVVLYSEMNWCTSLCHRCVGALNECPYHGDFLTLHHVCSTSVVHSSPCVILLLTFLIFSLHIARRRRPA